MSTDAAATAASSSSHTIVSASSPSIEHNDPHTIREGKAIVKRPPKEAGDAVEEEDEDGQRVFYNPVQVFNRDLSILIIQTFVDERKAEYDARYNKRQQRIADHKAACEKAKAEGKPEPVTNIDMSYVMTEKFPGITILEALSATGLRSIRYFKEISDVDHIIVNDMSADAIKSIEYNIELNGLTTKQLVPSHNDAITLMQKYRPPPFGPATVPRPQVIDLDPYGTAAPFLDSAVQAIDEGGLLAITCTDKAILCGNYSETCWAKYGSMPLKGGFCHETAIRIVLNTISSACIRYGRHMVPMLSMSIDFYVRVFVRVYTSSEIAKKQSTNMGMILACVGCESFWPHSMGKTKTEGTTTKYTPNSVDAPLGEGSKCPQCASTIKMGGPFWLGPLHNKTFVSKALTRVKEKPELFATHQRMIGMLTVCNEELQEGEEKQIVDRKLLHQEKMAALEAKKAAEAAGLPTSAPILSGAEKKLQAANEPKPKDQPLNSLLYYSVPHMFLLFNSSQPKLSILRSAIINAGYKVSQSHASHNALKTTAPHHVMWDIMRCWLAQNPPKNSLKEGSPGYRLMQHAPRLKADFTIVPGTDLSSYATGVAKFLPNPEENWGPKAKAGQKRKGNGVDDQSKRRKMNQGKRTRVRQCKAFAESGSCSFGDNCKYAHVPGAKAGENVADRLNESLSKGNDASITVEESSTSSKPMEE